MAGWHHWLDGHESGWTPGVGDEQGGLASNSQRVGHDWATELNWIKYLEILTDTKRVKDLYTKNCKH